jgi:uncharacterized OB-fold protein
MKTQKPAKAKGKWCASCGWRVRMANRDACAYCFAEVKSNGGKGK